MSEHVGHLAFFSLAADLRPLQIKMFATKTICTIQFFDIFNEISRKIHVNWSELLQRKARQNFCNFKFSTEKLQQQTFSTSYDNSKIDRRFRKALKISCTNSPGQLSCIFSVQNRWGARENHGEEKREYYCNQNFYYNFVSLK